MKNIASRRIDRPDERAREHDLAGLQRHAMRAEPVRKNGGAIAAVTVVAVKQRAPRERTPEIVAHIRRCIASIEAGLDRRLA